MSDVADSKSEWTLPPRPDPAVPEPRRRSKARTLLYALVIALVVVYAGATTMGYSARLRFWAQEQLPAYLDSSKVTPVDSEVVIEMTKQSCTLPPRLAQKKHY